MRAEKVAGFRSCNLTSHYTIQTTRSVYFVFFLRREQTNKEFWANVNRALLALCEKRKDEDKRQKDQSSTIQLLVF